MDNPTEPTGGTPDPTSQPTNAWDQPAGTGEPTNPAPADPATPTGGNVWTPNPDASSGATEETPATPQPLDETHPSGGNTEGTPQGV